MISSHRLLILASAVLFATGGIAIKATELSGWQVAGFRSGLAALFLTLVPSWRVRLEPRTLAVGAAYGATMILFVLANKLTTAANAIFLESSAPLYVLFLAPLMLGEKTRLRHLIVTVAIGLGLLLVFTAGDPPLATAPDPALGNLVALSAGLTWAFAIVGLRWLARGRPASAGGEAGSAVIAGNWIAFLLCLPLALPTFGTGAAGVAVGAADWAVVVYLGVFQMGLAYVLLTRGLGGVPALQASLLLLAEPVLTGLLAWAVYGEEPGPRSLLGYGLILAATAGLAAFDRDPGGLKPGAPEVDPPG